ncbi:Epimerase family protein [Thalassoglobus neptunius]|uniref:Epimerase family protein n=1 Tax=Thalassoglobus neptunius TaxID=1938619 RepID=A0A5C5WY24_9PLAN|nr:TIGR01777 family oxidoreductase [Thalassoglobus neptunius]TWT55576.1 Epimerase family protein [Thalassoglobus neptunius]
MHVFVTGASGLLGSYLCPMLEQSGHEVTWLTRKQPTDPHERQWDPKADTLPREVLDGCDVLVHLAGESIAEGRWNEAKKNRIRESRVHSTNLLAQALTEQEKPATAFIVASAIGYYGDRGDEVLTEASNAGSGFLADVCQEWEAAAEPAKYAGIRTAHIRTGLVLAKEGGALPSMLTPFKFGVGGVIGSGDQYWSWISIKDIARLFQFAVENDSVSGPVNGTAPHPVTNREFTKTLGKVISRPTVLPLPGFAAKLALGEMAEALILASSRVLPEQAEKHDFNFAHPDLEQALRELNL